MADLTYAEISKLLKYDPETGKLFWLPRTPDMFASGIHHPGKACSIWNNAFSDKEAFTASDGRYRQGTILGKRHAAHRVCWLLHYKAWPKFSIDHINGDGHDNRISNLRDVPHSTNLKNQKLRSTNKSGVSGVYWHRKAGKWSAQIRVNGARKYLGLFDNIEQASVTIQEVAACSGFHANHGARR